MRGHNIMPHDNYNAPNRRDLLAGAAATTLFLAESSVTSAQTRPPRNAIFPLPARERLEEALTRIADPKGEGARTCLTVYMEAARAAAEAADARALAGVTLGPLDGVIVTIKDLFD